MQGDKNMHKNTQSQGCAIQFNHHLDIHEQEVFAKCKWICTRKIN